MNPDQLRLTPTERANLVAYLDGELPEAESRAIATKLTQSATARREIESLRQTWELLNHLPRPSASEQFTERTLSEVRRFEAEGGRFETLFAQVIQRLSRAGLWVAVSIGAFAVSFSIARWVWPNPTAQLQSNLSIAEHLDEYREVGTFEFLQQLANSPEFGKDGGD